MSPASSEREESYAAQRELMVRRQLEPRGIHDERVLDAMAKVPRHEFVPETQRGRAYADHAMPVGLGQTISQPFMVAVMTQHLLGPKRGRLGSVLEVGGGTGYQAAILAEVADRVLTVERVPELAERAQETLARLGYDGVRVVVGDGTKGLAEEAPFDGILVAAAAPFVPPPLRDQLALGGRLVVPVGSRGLQELIIVQRVASGLHEDRRERCVFVPLIGEHGWEDR